MRKPLLIPTLAATLLVSACGNSAHHGSINKQTMRDAHASGVSEAKMKEQFITQAEGKRDSLDTMDYHAGTNQCSISVFLTTPADVKLYAGPGQGVVTNSAQTFGVKMGADQGSSNAACASEAQQVLATVR